MMILINESMKIKRQFRWDKYKAAGCLGNYAATILVLGLTPSDSDCLQHNFLAAVLELLIIQRVRDICPENLCHCFPTACIFTCKA